MSILLTLRLLSEELALQAEVGGLPSRGLKFRDSIDLAVTHQGRPYFSPIAPSRTSGLLLGVPWLERGFLAPN